MFGHFFVTCSANINQSETDVKKQLVLAMLKVTCAIIIKENKILITQRGRESDHALKWEFPGGKVKKGETNRAAIKREIFEELQLKIEIVKVLLPVIHHYSEFSIELNPFLCTIKSGKMVLNEHTDYKWITLDKLLNFDLTEADKKLIQRAETSQFLKEYIGK